MRLLVAILLVLGVAADSIEFPLSRKNDIVDAVDRVLVEHPSLAARYIDVKRIVGVTDEFMERRIADAERVLRQRYPARNISLSLHTNDCSPRIFYRHPCPGIMQFLNTESPRTIASREVFDSKESAAAPGHVLTNFQFSLVLDWPSDRVYAMCGYYVPDRWVRLRADEPTCAYWRDCMHVGCRCCDTPTLTFLDWTLTLRGSM